MDEEIESFHLIWCERASEAGWLLIKDLGAFYGMLAMIGFRETGANIDGVGKEWQNEIDVLLQKLSLLRVELIGDEIRGVFDDIGGRAGTVW